MIDLTTLPLSSHHRQYLDRFVAACAADVRVIAALLGGSYAKGTADAHSDIDLSIIVTDAGYQSFYDQRAVFLGELGDLLFLEYFNQPTNVLAIYADGTEAELTFTSPNRLDQIECGPFLALIDKQGILADASFPPPMPTPTEQHEIVRRQITWFWHDLSHFNSAMARGQLWWAYGQLDELRCYCMNLMRLQHDITGDICGYEKIDKALPSDVLALLADSCVPFERDAILRAGYVLVQCYQQIARPLAAAHGLPYPVELERVILERLMLGANEQT